MVILRAFIKKFGSKSLITGDAESEIVLRFKHDPDELKAITDLYRADQEVVVVIAGEEDGQNMIRDAVGSDHGTRPRLEQRENPADNG